MLVFIFIYFSFTESDLILCFATFIACLVLPLEYGIIVGVGINLLFILYHAARPEITVERLTVRYILYNMYFDGIYSICFFF